MLMLQMEQCIYAIVWSYKNISSKPVSSFRLPNLYLTSPERVRYSSDIGATVAYKTQLKLKDKVLSDLNPGISVRSAKVFEVAQSLFELSSWKIRVQADDEIYVGFPKNIDTSNMTVSNSRKENTESNVIAASPGAKISVGDMFVSGNFEFQIMNVEYRQSVGGTYIKANVTDDGLYVAVTWRYKNIGYKPIGMFLNKPSIYLNTTDGIKYNRDIEASSAYAIEIGVNEKIVSDLNPGISVQTVDVFEVNKDMFSQETWNLGIETDKNVKISLYSRHETDFQNSDTKSIDGELESVIKGYYHACNEGNSEMAMDFWVPSSRSKSKQQMTENIEHFRVDSFDLINCDKDDICHCKVTATGNSKGEETKTWTFHISMKRLNDAWKMIKWYDIKQQF